MNFQLSSSSSSSSEDSLSRSSTSLDSSTIITPMDSVFPGLSCRDILRIIFEKLPVSALFRARCVCRVWNSVASERDIVIRAFTSPWKLKGVVGNPVSGSFWRDNGLGKFAISHRIVRGDTVASLAVRYSVQVMDIKRLNNMMSDHGIYSRERLLIPISNPDTLINRTCYIEMDDYSKREVAVIYPEDVPDDSCIWLSDGMSLDKGNRMSMVEGKRRVIDSLRRSMQADGETAQYYLSISNGDPRAALSEFSADLKWERQLSSSDTKNFLASHSRSGCCGTSILGAWALTGDYFLVLGWKLWDNRNKNIFMNGSATPENIIFAVCNLVNHTTDANGLLSSIDSDA